MGHNLPDDAGGEFTKKEIDLLDGHVTTFLCWNRLPTKIQSLKYITTALVYWT